VAWYVVWRRLYPDAARRARIRRSRAARRALHLLRHAGPRETPAIVADYLRQRLDLATAEPTPAEVVEHLYRVGMDGQLADRTADFLHACDAARFAPHGNGDELPGQAADLVLELEGARSVSKGGLAGVVGSSRTHETAS
jgi:hypothetical protein